MNLSTRLDEQITPVVAAAGLLLTSTLGDTTYVSMKGHAGCMIVISIADGTTVTGSTITLKQATAVAGTSEKALGFTRMLANTDYGASKALTETAVISNTFTTQTTNSKDSLYVIDVKAEDLDVANGFDCLRLDGTGHAATSSRGVVVLYVLYGKRFSDSTPVQAIAD
jgi:hypothetical protein